ncbi:MAG: PVC-type heme-binding CxxCH protein [Verrucomicrobiota bacterium]
MKLPVTLCLAGAALPFTALAAEPAPRPVYASHRLTPETVGHAVDIKVDLTGAKKLYLVVRDGGDGFACDWADWVNPVLRGDFGEKKLTDLKAVAEKSGWGAVRKNANANGQPMKVDGKAAAAGIGVHATSVIEYDLPAGTKEFTAQGALDDGGVSQGGGSTVVFEVYTQKPVVKFGPVNGGAQEPGPALEALDAPAGLKVETFASEPMILSPSSIDIDHLGRVWVAEIVNYRAHSETRKEGDRILVLEDTDHDGKADKQTVFYQGKDIDSPHGVTVLGNRVIVSGAGKVMILTDEDGDLKSDKKELLFTGITGSQHDHSIHAVHFGPDGKLYFNYGNEGKQLKDKDGKILIDAAGNETRNKGQYQEGMIFRCDLDGSHVETLAWNFRNNWELAVDSFGAIWQSDNDDDGNRSVRINAVLPWGNYGFHDELTGATWSKGDAKTQEETVQRHWHQSDPGVVPNLLNTGAGSPSGITIYEGELLPAVFRNQMIHAEPGQNVARAYPVKVKGAGYSAETVNILEGTRDRWFRPVDVSTAPDGSLLVADWYDPGVGGHGMGDLDHGRIYRITPAGHKGYTVPAFDLSTPEGAVAALSQPNEESRYLGFTTLRTMGQAAVPALTKLADSPNPRLKARALWVLSGIPGQAETTLQRAFADADENIRATGIRIARGLGGNDLAWLKKGAGDTSAGVRRETAVSLRFSKSPEAPAIWAQLAAKHDGTDRFYLEALGIGAALRWDECLAAYLKLVPKPEDSAAGRDIIWRSRAQQTAAILATIVKSPALPEADKDRFMRAFDFQPKEEREKALESLLQ